MTTVKSFVACVVAVLLVLLLGVTSAQVQEKRELLTVKSSEEGNGVVVVTGRGEKATVELQCNKGFFSCNTLKPGEYTMVRLPKNQGAYDCSNVTVYAKSTDSAVSREELGTYCITER